MASSFAEVQFEAGYIIYGTQGGALFSTDIVVLNSGSESRNQNWQFAKGTWDFGDRKLPDTELKEIIRFFRARKGSVQGFRFKDWGDYQDWGSGQLGSTGTGLGIPGPYQLVKNYTSGSDTDQRYIRKPVSSTIKLFLNGAQLVAGVGAGNYALDSTTGLVTLVPTLTSNASAITAGANTQVTLAANLGLVAGNLLYLDSFAGTDAALINNKTHTIVSRTGVGPYVFTIATTTASISLGTGKGSWFPQVADILTWTGEFDVPVRFDTDELKYRFDSATIAAPGTVLKTYFYLSPLPLKEVRV